MKRATLSGLLAALGPAVVLASPAAAVPPEIEPFHVDETFVVPAGGLCEFPVELHITGHFRVALYYDRDGNLKFVSENPSLVDTLTNPLNGKTVTSNDRGLDKFVLNDDGTISLLSTAIHFKYQVPGEGVVFADISLRVVTFDADFNVISFEVRGGRVDGDIGTFICTALA
jgi:hypothetical protein